MDVRRAERGLAGALLLGAAMLTAAGQAAAQDRGGYLKFTPTAGMGNFALILAIVGGALVLLLVLRMVGHFVGGRAQPAPRAAAPRRVSADFGQQASRLGFRVAEIKTLRLVTARLAPQDADLLLASEQGRERLAGYIEKRLRRRERELEHLRGILAKLRLIRDQGIRERATVRVEANLPVWIVRKADTAEAAEDEEDVYADVEQVSGRMLDVSEGGAAVAAELDAQPADLVELWSADADIWIPPVTASVLQVQRQGVDIPVFHLHFLDPPVGELRAAIQALQRQASAGR
ncbi:MAG: PilZ domain-containing protein [Candidatus Latescibacterota bacterium]